MRAKVIVVVLVVFGLLGGAVITAAATDSPMAAGDEIVLAAGDTMGDTNVPAHRDNGKGHHDEDEDNGDGWCIAEEGSVVGPVCVSVDELEVLSDILSTDD
jgi:hypothetical protein